MTKLFSKRRYAFLPGLCCSLLLLSACASTIRTEDTIESRATARWDTLLSDDLAGAYEFLSPVTVPVSRLCSIKGHFY